MMAVVAILIGLTTGVISGLATLLLPIGLFGFLQYYRQGHVDLRVAALLAGRFRSGRVRRGTMGAGDFRPRVAPCVRGHARRGRDAHVV